MKNTIAADIITMIITQKAITVYMIKLSESLCGDGVVGMGVVGEGVVGEGVVDTCVALFVLLLKVLRQSCEILTLLRILSAAPRKSMTTLQSTIFGHVSA